MRRPRVLLGLLVLLGSGCARVPGQEVPDVRTPPVVVNEMLRLANVTPGDVVYDLGSGDGRIVIAAARDRGARGVGFEIDPALVAQATARAKRLGLAERVTFHQQDLFQADLRPATVVTLYLGMDLNRRIRPKLMAELRPGARVVSHNYDMDDWAPWQTLKVESHEGSHTLYLWIVPEKK
ncbi:MAG TPA: class I SAM-dependent methyltransferase [Methylomirabilota bacterium]|jgi:predicted TPR repeat methyltransferase